MLRFFAVLVDDLHDSGLWNRGLATDVIDFVFLEKHLDAACEAVGDLAAAADHFVPLVGEAFDFQTKVASVVFDRLINFSILEKRLGGDASPVQTGAAGTVHFNHRHLFSELSRANRPHITCRSAAHHDQIIISHSF